MTVSSIAYHHRRLRRADAHHGDQCGRHLQKQANPNVFTTITQLPSLQGSTGTTVGNGGSSNGVNGLSALNIRGVGTQRNLILIDGERVIPTSHAGRGRHQPDPADADPARRRGDGRCVGFVGLGRRVGRGQLRPRQEVRRLQDERRTAASPTMPTIRRPRFSSRRVPASRVAAPISKCRANSQRSRRQQPGRVRANGGRIPQQLQQYTVAQCQPNGCPGGSPQWINGQSTA